MLARASSDAGTRLRRSKSTSTVHRHPPPISEPLDPDLAHQHAVAAATAAFARAQVHNATGRKTDRSSEISRSKSGASRKSLASQGSHFPPRESSLRSLQPPKAGKAASSSRQQKAPTTDTEKYPPFYPTLNSYKPFSAPRPSSAQPSVSFSEHDWPRLQSKPLGQTASPSITSQQIRKARSMYYASNIQTGSPIARPSAKYLVTQSSNIVKSDPKPPSSLPETPILGVSPLTTPRIPVTVAPDETIDKARDKYLQSFQQRTVQHKPSIFLAPFKKRSEKATEKNTRVVSGASVPLHNRRTPEVLKAEVSPDELPLQRSAKEKRSFSGSLKSKFKKVFRRTSSKLLYLPAKQIGASHEHFDAAHMIPPVTNTTYAITSPDEETLRRVRSRTPSLERKNPAFVRSAFHNSESGSVRSDRSKHSMHSEANSINASASRVTSWGTTSTGDTQAQQSIKRLTIIHEAKDSIGSETERMSSTIMQKPLPCSVLSAFRDPMPMESLAEESLTPVDPKRVFSALMREIGTSTSSQDPSFPVHRTPGGESDIFESSKTKGLQLLQGRELHSSSSRDFRPSFSSDQRPSRRPPSIAAQSVHSKASTIKSLGEAIKSTIRTVTPGERPSFPSSKRKRTVHGAHYIPRDASGLHSSVATSVSNSVDQNQSAANSDGVWLDSSM